MAMVPRLANRILHEAIRLVTRLNAKGVAMVLIAVVLIYIRQTAGG